MGKEGRERKGIRPAHSSDASAACVFAIIIIIIIILYYYN